MKIILATRNPEKARQIKDIFEGTDVEILTLDEARIEGEAVEDGSSLEDNAKKKALYALEMTAEEVYTMADDTGLFIHALNDEPGRYAARWAGENATTEEAMRYCLKMLRGKIDRSATFRTTVALCSPSGECRFFYGEVEGDILKEPRVKPQEKMPYSAIFVPRCSKKSWAEMSTKEENAISHRGKAFREVLKYITELALV